MLETTFTGRVSSEMAVDNSEKKFFRFEVVSKEINSYQNVELTKFYKDERPSVFDFLVKNQLVCIKFRPEPLAWIDKNTGELKKKQGGIVNTIEILFPADTK